MQEIKRDTYLQRLIDKKENGLIKVITGIRRCRKFPGTHQPCVLNLGLIKVLGGE